MIVKQLQKCLLASAAFILLISRQIEATHIRAGEIIAERLQSGNFTYRFTFIGYTDTGSTVELGAGELNFGDGTTIPIEEGSDIFEKNIEIDSEKKIAYNEYVITHTFPGPGTYTVSFNEKNRNADIKNIYKSVDTPFYVETTVTIDPAIGRNSTPVLLIPPIDDGAVGIKYTHNAGAFDPDGDSLSYRIVIPKQFKNQYVNDYVLPNDAEFYGNKFSTGNQAGSAPPEFKIDQITGDLIWDAPGAEGEYNVAFIVEEWRQIGGVWRRLGYVTRDMQIIIEDASNDPPELYGPDELCVVAGEKVAFTVIGSDENGDDVKIEAFGGPFEDDDNPAVFENNNVFGSQPLRRAFEWQTDCFDVRKRPYELRFKITDRPIPPMGPRLTEFKNAAITVYAPAPTGLTAEVETGRSVRLNWDNYNCGTADKMEIYRRIGDFNFVPGACMLGIPENGGYELIAVIDIGKHNNTVYRTTFLDDNNGKGLAPGANYCYRIVAVFPEPAGGKSVVSDESCDVMLADAPVTINIDITNTDRDNGEIFVRWLEPFEIDQAQFPPPYKYKVFRYQGFSGDDGETEVAFIDELEFVDKGLNTQDLAYNYQVDVYNNNGSSYVASSVRASSVRLALDARVGELNLRWTADVPWSLLVQDHPYQRIYRAEFLENERIDYTTLVLYDSAKVTDTGLRFMDRGNAAALSDKSVYCYYVETKGSYGNPAIDEPLLNKSNILCASPNDQEKPCPPITFGVNEGISCEEKLQMDNLSCEASLFTNLISWELNLGDECDDDVDKVEIWYSPDGVEPYERVAARELSQGNTYLHEGLSSYKGFYYVQTVDRSGNTSIIDEPVSMDNCPNYELPNVFTPNADGKNDVFSPFTDNAGGISIPDYNKHGDCPRFVESVAFRVFDRTGGVLFTYNSDSEDQFASAGIWINWDGKTNSGVELAAGVYYYRAEVAFDVLDKSKANQVINGWVQILK